MQCITTNDGYVIPLNIKSGLPYMPMRPYTDSEWDTLPHVILTADSDWDPTVLDNDLADDDEWFDAVSDMPEDPVNTPFDQFGDYRHTHIVTEAFLSNSILDNSLIMDLPTLYQAHERRIQPKDPDYEALCPNFGWLPTDVIKQTFQNSTQFARIPMSTTLTKHYKSPFPANNVHRRNEPLATDTVYSDTH